MMRKKKNRLGIVGLCLLLLLITGLSFTAMAEEPASKQRVFDQAGLMTEEERASVSKELEQAIEDTHMDLVVVTTNDAEGKTAMEYADDFYDYGGYGLGKDASGALFLIDMDNREIYISTSGMMIRFLTDARIDKMLDNAYAFVSGENYVQAAKNFAYDVTYYYNKGIESGQYNYDPETGEISVYKSIRWYEALLALIASAIPAGLSCRAVKNQYAMKKEHAQAGQYNFAYRQNAAFVFNVATDQLLRKNTTQRHIVRASATSGGGGGRIGSSSGRSTTHHSSSGRSHGGGGRKF